MNWCQFDFIDYFSYVLVFKYLLVFLHSGNLKVQINKCGNNLFCKIIEWLFSLSSYVFSEATLFR